MLSMYMPNSKQFSQKKKKKSCMNGLRPTSRYPRSSDPCRNGLLPVLPFERVKVSRCLLTYNYLMFEHRHQLIGRRCSPQMTSQTVRNLQIDTCPLYLVFHAFSFFFSFFWCPRHEERAMFPEETWARFMGILAPIACSPGIITQHSPFESLIIAKIVVQSVEILYYYQSLWI